MELATAANYCPSCHVRYFTVVGWMAIDILWMWDLDAGTIIDHGLYLQLLAIT